MSGIRCSTLRSFLASALLLAGCSQPEPEYSLSSILPASVMPGGSVVAYGVLPADAALRLEGDVIIGLPVPDGLQVTIPEWTIAGTHTLTVEAGSQSFAGVVQVVPRIDQVRLEGLALTISGAGWPSSLTPSIAVSIDVGGLLLSPVLIDGSLSVSLPENLGYGNLSVRVSVAGQVSEPYSLTREAAAVRGRVTLPASVNEAPRASPQLASLDTSTLSNLIVYGSPSTLKRLELSGLSASTALSLLNVTRLSFASHEAAGRALEQLQRAGLEVEWDIPVTIDGFEALNSGTPATPGAGQWHLPLLGLGAAWEGSKGEGVTVAVIDTGVMLDHPDLAPNLLPGYDFVDNDAEPYDLAGHGTHVAGLVAANGQALGTAPEAKILPVRVLEGTSGGSSFTVAQGILWAAGLLNNPPNPNPAQVINLSLGSSSYSEVLAGAIAQVQAAGVIVVAATGNAGGPVAYPAALPGVVSVTALAGPTLPYQPWYANKGLGVWLTGYGGDTSQDQDGDGHQDGILSTDLSGYSYRMGTSMASPQVAGLAALALSSGIPAPLVRDALAGTATDLGVMGLDRNFGYGLATGRTVTTSNPRSYVIALDQDKKLIAWTLVQEDLSFELGNLPPDVPITLLAASDEDGDGILGEASEHISSPVSSTAPSGELSDVEDFMLSISDGTYAIALEEQP